MGKFVFLVCLIMCAVLVVHGAKYSGRSSSSRGRTTTRSGTGWKKSSGSTGQSGSATRGSSYGWTVPKAKPAASPGISKPAGSSGGWVTPGSKTQGTSGWGVPGTKPQSTSGWATSGTKPAASSGWGVPGTKPQSTSGWATVGTKPAASPGFGTTGTKPQTSSGWGVAQKPATPYGLSPPNTPPKPQTSYGWTKPQATSGSSTGFGNAGVASSTHLKSPSNGFSNSGVASSTHLKSPSGGNIPASTGNVYNGPKKQIINNHYHYNTPAAHTPSHYGVSSSYNPPQNNFGYSGGHYGGHTPSYGGMGLFSGGSGYGYPSSGWGQSSYGSQRSGLGLGSGILIGAVGGVAAGYLTSSLVNSLTHRASNPWGYSGHGYGSGYTDRYSPYNDNDRSRPPPPAATAEPIVDDPTKNWIQCVAFDPATRATLVNPNCTCEVTVTMDSVTGQNISHHDCTPREKTPQPIPVYVVPSPNGDPAPGGPTLRGGNLHGEAGGMAYGGGYGTGGTVPDGPSQMGGTVPEGGSQAGGAAPEGGSQTGGTVPEGGSQTDGTNLAGSVVTSDSVNSTVTDIVSTSTSVPVAA